MYRKRFQRRRNSPYIIIIKITMKKISEALFITNYVMPFIREHKKLYGQIVAEGKSVKKAVSDSLFEPQQLPSLRLATTDEGISFKIPDGSGIATPFDCIHISNAKAFVAVHFDAHGWCLIDIHVWDKKPKEHMTFDDCIRISDHYYYL